MTNIEACRKVRRQQLATATRKQSRARRLAMALEYDLVVFDFDPQLEHKLRGLLADHNADFVAARAEVERLRSLTINAAA